MGNDKTNTRKVVANRMVMLTLPLKTDTTLEDAILMWDGCYGDLFTTTRQKRAAWKLYEQYCIEKGAGDGFGYGVAVEDYYLGEVLYFFFNASVDADFIRYCAEAEDEDDALEYFLGLAAN